MAAPAPGGRRGLAARLALFYGATFAVVGVLTPFWPVWLVARGLDAKQIGMVLAVVLALKVVANPVAAHVADRLGERRRPMIVLAAASLGAFALYFPAHGFWAILAITAVFSATRAGVMPLGESLAMMSAYAHGLDYGRVRLWGSLTFIAAAAATGALLVGRDADLVYWLALATLAVSVAACLALPDARPPGRSRARLPLRRLLAQPLFILFLAAGALVQGGHAVYYAFSTLHWRAAGHSDAVIGMLWAEGVVAEIVLFAMSDRVVRTVGPAGLLALGGIAAVLRWTVTAESTDLGVLAAVQALHALTFGAAHLGAMHFITRAVPAAMSASAQSLYAAVVTGLGLGLATLAAGPLYAAFAGGAFHASAAMGLAGGVCALLLMRAWPGGEMAGLGGGTV